MRPQRKLTKSLNCTEIRMERSNIQPSKYNDNQILFKIIFLFVIYTGSFNSLRFIIYRCIFRTILAATRHAFTTLDCVANSRKPIVMASQFVIMNWPRTRPTTRTVHSTKPTMRFNKSKIIYDREIITDKINYKNILD